MKVPLAALLLLLATRSVRADSYEEHDYILNCSGCHGLDGSGSRMVPSLQAMPEISAVPGARQYWVRVPGAAQAPLSDARLAALMNWLVQRFTGTTPEPSYTSEEVRHLRSEPLRDPIAARNELRARTP
ncbi:MAG: hypothetical protein WCE62_01810 [Polyangiales bacterium]